MTEQWQELKATITELRDSDGTGTQQEICMFLTNLMDILEKQMEAPCEDAISRQAAIDLIKSMCGVISPISDDVIFIDKGEAIAELNMLPTFMSGAESEE